MFSSEAMAVGTAICIALGSMLANELKGRIDVPRLIRWQFVSAFVMSAIASLFLGDWASLTVRHLWLMALSSLCGVIIAGTTYFNSIYRAGPRVTALLFSLCSPFALLLGYVVLDETITLRQGGGVALVLLGIVLAIGRERGAQARTKVPWGGIVLGTATALFQALGTLAARPAMETGAEPFAAMTVRIGVAALFFSLLLFVPSQRLNAPYRFQGRDLALTCASSFFGAAFGTVLLMAALAEGNVGIVSTLSSMTPIVILPMVWIRTGVPPPPLAWIGAVLAVAGTALISL